MKQKALLVVPHQDDECDLAGNIISVLMNFWDLYIIYSSLETDPIKGLVRKKEAIEACKIWGLDESKLFFFEYPDTPNKMGKHYYSEGDHRIIESLVYYILDMKPALIIGTDFDYHSDHRMLSLALDMAMGKILKWEIAYHPIVLKGFCYETAYYGVPDYSASAPGKCKPKYKILSNATYEWDNRISIASNEKPGMIWHRKCYKALAQHKSQYAILHARSIVNDDNVFWLRRTDNLALAGEVLVSSGDGTKLNDFMILDTDDIITLNPRNIDYSKAIWKPDDCDQHISIKIRWASQQLIDTVVLHGNPNNTVAQSVRITISTEEKKLSTITTIKEYGRSSIVHFMPVQTSILIFTIEKANNLGLSEIEVFGDTLVLPELLQRTDLVNEYNKNKFIDYVNELGYKIIVIFQKVRRKCIGLLK